MWLNASGERAQLGRRRGARIEPGGEVAGVDLGRGGGEAAQRRGGPRREQVAGEQGRRQARPADHEEGLLDVGLGVLDRRDRGALARLARGRPGLARLARLLALDHRRLVRHLRPHGDEDDGEGEDDDRPDRERQPAAQPQPRPGGAHPALAQPVPDRAHGLDRQRRAGPGPACGAGSRRRPEPRWCRDRGRSPRPRRGSPRGCRPGRRGASGRRAAPTRGRGAGPRGHLGSPPG